MGSVAKKGNHSKKVAGSKGRENRECMVKGSWNYGEKKEGKEEGGDIFGVVSETMVEFAVQRQGVW